MTIEILYLPGCPNYLPAVERVENALREEAASAEIKHLAVVDAATGMAIGFPGSPTVRINGVDVERPARSSGFSGLCCRTYRDGMTREGAPSVALIREAIRELASPGRNDRCVHE